MSNYSIPSSVLEKIQDARPDFNPRHIESRCCVAWSRLPTETKKRLWAGAYGSEPRNVHNFEYLTESERGNMALAMLTWGYLQ